VVAWWHDEEQDPEAAERRKTEEYPKIISPVA
jgi:hypothetical protein